MQEMRRDGTELLTAAANLDQIKAALENRQNREVRLHMPGSIIDTMADGHRKKFRVEDDGSLTRVHLKTLVPLDDSP